MSELEEAGDQGAIRLQKLLRLRQSGQDPFAIEKYERTHTAAQIVAEDAAHWQMPDEQREALSVSAAGRLTAHRTKGKVTFADIRDESGRVQMYVKRDDVGDAAFELFNELDLSDFVGVTGFPFVTRTGEPSLHVKTVTLLAKALRPVPFGKQDDEGKVYGALSNVEDRYRYRYLDLLANPQARDILTKRSKVVSAMRRFLDARGLSGSGNPGFAAHRGRRVRPSLPYAPQRARPRIQTAYFAGTLPQAANCRRV